MRFSVWLSSGWAWDDARAAAIHADRTGWNTIWVPDHFMPPEDGYGSEAPGIDPELSPVHEAWTLVAAIAAVTERSRVGVLVSGNTYRHPAVVAKMAATIDHISNGRAVLGLGAGWQENEHRRYGIPFPPPAERSDRLEEAAAMISGLLSPRRRTSFEGVNYRLTDAPLEPKPIQSPMPLLIGGTGERRTMRTAARYASEWNCWGTPETMEHKGAVLARHCAEAERRADEVAMSTNAFVAILDDPSEGRMRRTAMGERGGLVGTPDQIRAQVEAYAAAGVGEIVIAGFDHSAARFVDTLDEFRGVIA